MNCTKTLELAQGYSEKALVLAKPFAKPALFAVFDAWEKIEQVDWDRIGERVQNAIASVVTVVAALFMVAVMVMLFTFLHTSLLLYAVAQYVFRHRDDIKVAAVLVVGVMALTASFAWDEFVRRIDKLMSEFVALGMAGVLGLTLFI